MSFMCCCVDGCKVTKKGGGVLHKFPRPDQERDRFQKWVRIVGDSLKGYDDVFIYNNRRVCRRHFSEVYLYPQNRLCVLATPTLNIPGYLDEKDPLSTTTPNPLSSTTPDPPSTTTPDPLSAKTPDPDPISQTTPKPRSATTPDPLSTTTPEPLSTTTPEPLSTTPQPLSTTPQPLSATTPKPLSATTPKRSAKTPKPLSATTPKRLSTTTPKSLSATTPKRLSTTTPQHLSGTTPDRLSPTSPDSLLDESDFNLSDLDLDLEDPVQMLNIKKRTTPDRLFSPRDDVDLDLEDPVQMLKIEKETIPDRLLDVTNLCPPVNMKYENKECFSCKKLLNDEIQCYALSEVGSELCSILSRNLHREVDYKSHLCDDCFTRVTIQLSSESRDPAKRCVLCLRSIVGCHGSHVRLLTDGPEKDDIARRIFPRQVQPGDKVCHPCWCLALTNNKKAQKLELKRIRQQNSSKSTTSSPPQPEPIKSEPQEDTVLSCVWCRTVLAKVRSHSLPESPEREFIAIRISPRQIKPGSRVCNTCWLSVKRCVPNKEVEKRMSKRKRMSNLAIYDVPFTTLPNFSRTINSSKSCFVYGCNNNELHVVPDILKCRILKLTKLFITENARVCTDHLTVNDWEFLKEYVYSKKFTTSQLEEMVSVALTNDEIQFVYKF